MTAVAVPRWRRPAARSVAITLHAVMAANALAGAWYAIGGAPGVPTDWLDGTPFDDYVVPGVILGTVVAGSQIAAGIALLRRRPRARQVSRAAGGILLGWIVVQLAMIGYVSPLQPLVLGWALGTLALTRPLRTER